MAPSTVQQVLLSPAELSYLHTSLSLSPPIRPDGRTSTQFRPLIAECGILPGTNGSARVCFADGTEAIVGVKAEVEKSRPNYQAEVGLSPDDDDAGDNDDADTGNTGLSHRSWNEWVEISVDIPAFRDDDSMPIFLAAMLSEALLADGEFTRKLWINARFHWKIYLDASHRIQKQMKGCVLLIPRQILLLSSPLSYPLPLLSLTSHLALLCTRLPKLISEKDEDPLFNDDWEASVFLYPRDGSGSLSRPPVTLVVMAVKDNIIFDPSKEELTVAEVVLAISVGEKRRRGDAMRIDLGRELRLLAVRSIDPPSRLTHPALPNALNTATGGIAATNEKAAHHTEGMRDEGVWQPPRGGAKRKLIASMMQQVLLAGGVAEEVLDGLDAVDLG